MIGFVYILSNEAMPGKLKIGYSATDPEQRAKALSSNTSVPQPFNLEYFCLVDDYEDVERWTHWELAPYRVNNRREFFEVDYATALAAIHEAARFKKIYHEEFNTRNTELVAAAGDHIEAKKLRITEANKTLDELKTEKKRLNTELEKLNDELAAAGLAVKHTSKNLFIGYMRSVAIQKARWGLIAAIHGTPPIIGIRKQIKRQIDLVLDEAEKLKELYKKVDYDQSRRGSLLHKIRNNEDDVLSPDEIDHFCLKCNTFYVAEGSTIIEGEETTFKVSHNNNWSNCERCKSKRKGAA